MYSLVNNWRELCKIYNTFWSGYLHTKRILLQEIYDEFSHHKVAQFSRADVAKILFT